MADYLVTDTELTDVANAIRTKAGLSETIEFPSEFVSAIANIPTGGTLQSKSVTPTESAQTVTPDSGYDGLSQVNVGAVSSTYVGTGVTRKSAQTYTPTTTDQTIASGQYLTGVQTIKGDANLLAENIKKDVVLFGITGTYEGSGGGNVNKLTLYTKHNYDTLYTDSACTESLLESCNYDYNEAFNTMVNADIVEIIRQGSNDHYYPVLIRADFVEDYIGVKIVRGNGNMDEITVY